MKRSPILSCAIIWLLTLCAHATTFYVDANGQNPTSPYTNWLTAATNIQDTLRFAADGPHLGDTVLVTNGIYQYGGQSFSRVYWNGAAITIQSVNGPDVTFIVGATNFASLTRCVYLAGPQTLSGFTLTNGGSASVGSGGVYCYDQSTVVSNCVMVGCRCGGSGSGTGAGAYSGTLINCLLARNYSSLNGGGAYASTLINCIVTNNTASSSGGGAYASILVNTLVISNKSALGGNGGGVASCSLTNCSLLGNSTGVAGNLGDGGGAASSTLYNCLLANNYAGYLAGAAYNCSLFGCTVVSNVSGAYGGTVSGGSAVNSIIFYNFIYSTQPDVIASHYTNCCTSFPTSYRDVNNTFMPPAFVNLAGGDFHLASNSPCLNTGTNLFVTTLADLDGNPRIYGGVVDIGAYENQSATQANSYTYYVNASNSAPVAPYLTWDTAATNIQDAIDIAIPGSTILVTNGLYAYGGRVVSGTMTNRAAVIKPLSLQSVNGPAATIILGNGGATGPAANGVRCVYLAAGASLAGFTLTNGATHISGDTLKEQSGGGIWCETNALIVTNCVIAGNQAYNDGGGAYQGNYFNCLFQTNTALNGGGGAAFAVLNNTTLANCLVTVYGGGAYTCLLTNCLLLGNQAKNNGGGAGESTLSGCVVSSNMAAGIGSGGNGGGVYYSTVLSSLVVSNNAGWGGGGYNSTFIGCVLSNNAASSTSGRGGGAYNGRLDNCLIVKNSANLGGGTYGATVDNGVLVFDSASGSGGGDCSGILNNTIVLLNAAPNGSNYFGSTINFCCTKPDAGGNSIAVDPLFVNSLGGDFHLQSNSPCINAGKNSYLTNGLDLAGNPRIVGGTVDLGAYEWQTPASVISYAWLQQYGLPADGSVDFANLDGTTFNVYQDWIAGLNPTNPASVLALQPPAATNTTGLTVTWQSVSTRNYYLQSSTNLSGLPAFTSIQSNIIGQAGFTSFTDTTATNGGPYFYRVGIQ